MWQVSKAEKPLKFGGIGVKKEKNGHGSRQNSF